MIFANALDCSLPLYVCLALVPWGQVEGRETDEFDREIDRHL